jgi:hypothetical protein
MGHAVMARYVLTLRGPRPHARRDTICTGTGRSLNCLVRICQAAAARPWPEPADARLREVRPVHSMCFGVQILTPYDGPHKIEMIAEFRQSDATRGRAVTRHGAMWDAETT